MCKILREAKKILENKERLDTFLFTPHMHCQKILGKETAVFDTGFWSDQPDPEDGKK